MAELISDPFAGPPPSRYPDGTPTKVDHALTVDQRAPDPLGPIATIWPTDGTGATWTDSRGYRFVLVNWLWAELLGWGCTVCMNDMNDVDVSPDPKEGDLFFVDADEWPWVDHGQNHPSFIHDRHFALANRPGKGTD